MKNKLRSIFLVSVLICQTVGYSQMDKAEIDKSQKLGEAQKSEIFETELNSKKQTPSGDLEWTPTLTSKANRVKHELPGEAEMKAVKAEKLAVKTTFAGVDLDDEGDVVYGGSTPIVGSEFLGNPNNGSSPMDNSIAISDDGLIVSVANTTIQFKTTGGGTFYSNSIIDFIDDPSISYVCDPVVNYDPEEDRFIFFAQECSGNSSNSHLIIMFSETNDPDEGWNYYKITGNPLGDNSWFDYPKLAISDTELFISGNLFYNGGGFNQSVVYQMEKFDGYDGDALTWQYWYDISASPFTLLPVSSGSNVNYGPGIYMVANSPFSGNTIKLYDITDAIAGSPTMDYYSVSTSYYDVAADASQLGTDCKLDNGDCRCLSGFYMYGTIHFVFQSDVGSSWNGINYNRLNVSTLTNSSDEFGDAGNMDYSYPSIAWFGFSPSDKSALISFGSVSSSVYPEIRAVHVNDAGDWSETTLIKESTSYACFTSPSIERWGDYTGTARRHNATEPSVWINGMYGTGSHRWNTWIAEIHADYSVGINENTADENLTIYPNPVDNTFILNFDVTEDAPVEVKIIGLDGRLVKHLYTGTAFVGENKFAFNKANLASGTYFVQIQSDDKQIANEKIIIR
ncbi:MAG: T9SS type A sorting domain-containing protein [Crocinitomix sp.]|nr:T9SS type A sorting domain-containing protein [Crocinitomix sp.]